MFPRRIERQSTFVFGPDIYTKLIPDTHILYKANKCVDFSFVNEGCRGLYSQDQGRPVKNRFLAILSGHGAKFNNILS